MVGLMSRIDQSGALRRCVHVCSCVRERCVCAITECCAMCMLGARTGKCARPPQETLLGNLRAAKRAMTYMLMTERCNLCVGRTHDHGRTRRRRKRRSELCLHPPCA